MNPKYQYLMINSKRDEHCMINIIPGSQMGVTHVDTYNLKNILSEMVGKHT